MENSEPIFNSACNSRFWKMNLIVTATGAAPKNTAVLMFIKLVGPKLHKLHAHPVAKSSTLPTDSKNN
jgi:hypothetical protein